MKNKIDIEKVLKENEKLKEQLKEQKNEKKNKQRKFQKKEYKLFFEKNKKKLIIGVILAVVISCIGIFIYYSQRFNIERFKENIVLILSYDKNGVLTSTGSGVYINNETIYTNAHVVDGAKKIEIVLDNNMKVKIKGIQTINNEKDIAILITEKIENIKNLKMNSKTKTGSVVYAVGSPFGIKNTVSEGIISGEYKDEQTNKIYLQHTAPISSGSSGGALVNKKGELIGINFATHSEGQNLNLAIMIDDFNKEYAETKSDELITVETSSFFEISELMNPTGKEIIKGVCSVDVGCNAFIDSNSHFKDTEIFKNMQTQVDFVIRIEALDNYDENYKGKNWVRIYLFKMNKTNENSEKLFKELVEYKSIETRDNYYYLKFNHIWSLGKNYYYYMEYDKELDVKVIVDSLNKFVGGNYD